MIFTIYIRGFCYTCTTSNISVIFLWTNLRQTMDFTSAEDWSCTFNSDDVNISKELDVKCTCTVKSKLHIYVFAIIWVGFPLFYMSIYISTVIL